MGLMTSKKRGGVRKVQLERKIWFFLTITEPCCSSSRGYGHTTRTETETLSLFTSKRRGQRELNIERRCLPES